MAAVVTVFTIVCVANILEDWLHDLSIDMFTEDGCLHASAQDLHDAAIDCRYLLFLQEASKLFAVQPVAGGWYSNGRCPCRCRRSLIPETLQLNDLGVHTLLFGIWPGIRRADIKPQARPITIKLTDYPLRGECPAPTWITHLRKLALLVA